MKKAAKKTTPRKAGPHVVPPDPTPAQLAALSAPKKPARALAAIQPRAPSPDLIPPPVEPQLGDPVTAVEAERIVAPPSGVRRELNELPDEGAPPYSKEWHDRVEIMTTICRAGRWIAPTQMAQWSQVPLTNAGASMEALAKIGYLEASPNGTVYRATDLAYERREIIRRNAVRGAADRAEARTAGKPPSPSPRERYVERDDPCLEGARELTELKPASQKRRGPPPRGSSRAGKLIRLLKTKNPHKEGTKYRGYFDALKDGMGTEAYVALDPKNHPTALSKFKEWGTVELYEEGKK